MKRILICSLVMVLAISGFVYAQPKPDFSGTWVLDTAKSDLGANNPSSKQNPTQNQMRKVKLIVKQTANELIIERPSGDTASYKLDGSESINNLPNGSQGKTIMSWASDTLVAKTTVNVGGKNVTITDVRSLDANGQVMTVRVTRQTPKGEMNQTLIYNKQ